MKKLANMLIPALSVVMLVGCDNPPPKDINVVREEVRSYEILKIDPPKHFHVSLMDVETHQLFERQGKRKHCHEWRKWSEHDHVNLTTQYYTVDGGEKIYIRLLDVAKTFCY